MKKTLINTVKTLLALIAFPFALASIMIFMLVTFGRMAVEKLVRVSG